VDRIERLAPGSFLAKAVLFTSNTKEDREALYVCNPGQAPVRVYEDNERRGIDGFDWGRTDDEVLLALDLDPSTGFTNTISSLDLKSSELKHLLRWDRRATASPANLGSVTAIAMAPSRRALAILGDIGGGPSALFIFDLTSGKCRLVHRFRDEERPSNPTWAPTGDRVAVELLRSNSDLFICDLDGAKATSRR
jgi:hypothetical protein